MRRHFIGKRANGFLSSGLASAVVPTAGLINMLDTIQYVQLSRKIQETSSYCIIHLTRSDAESGLPVVIPLFDRAKNYESILLNGERNDMVLPFPLLYLCH